MRGRDKLLELVDGEPLLRRQAKRARNVCTSVIVALPSISHPRHAALEGLDVSAVALPESSEGLSGTLRGFVTGLPNATEAFLLVLPDIPDLDTAHMTAVLAARNAHKDALVWRGATSDGRAGHPALFSRQTFGDFATISGDEGGQSVAHKYRDRTHLVPLPGDIARHDLDTPEEWAAWRGRQSSST